MSRLQELLPPKIYEVLERFSLCSVKQILVMSPWDIRKITNLNEDDIELIKNAASECSCPTLMTGDQLASINPSKVQTGVIAIDSALRGGFRCGTITEIYGESGSGKTQLTIQTTLRNYPKGTVYISTEDLFPLKRFEQIKENLSSYSPCNDYGKNVFLEHLTEPDELLSCVRVRLPKLLESHMVSLIVIDSIAAPFRADVTNYVQRAEDLRELAVNLLSLAQKHNLAVICINQVTSTFEESSNNVVPSLGLAWSNMVTTRLWVKKTNRMVKCYDENNSSSINIRELSVMFSPEVPQTTVDYLITTKGVEDLY